MMTEEQIIEYISNNEPTGIDKCPDCGRWLTRTWNMSTSSINETYTYKNAHNHRQSFAVKSVVRKEVSNV